MGKTLVFTGRTEKGGNIHVFLYTTKVISLIYFNISRLHHPFLLPLFLTLLFYSKNPLKALISITLRGCILLKLDISNYILCLSNLYIPLFGIIILKNLHILYHLSSFCNHFATITNFIIFKSLLFTVCNNIF